MDVKSFTNYFSKKKENEKIQTDGKVFQHGRPQAICTFPRLSIFLFFFFFSLKQMCPAEVRVWGWAGLRILGTVFFFLLLPELLLLRKKWEGKWKKINKLDGSIENLESLSKDFFSFF